MSAAGPTSGGCTAGSWSHLHHLKPASPHRLGVCLVWQQLAAVGTSRSWEELEVYHSLHLSSYMVSVYQSAQFEISHHYDP